VVLSGCVGDLAEGRGQRAEVRGQRSEVRVEVPGADKAESRKLKAEIPISLSPIGQDDRMKQDGRRGLTPADSQLSTLNSQLTVRLAWSNVPVGMPMFWKTGVEGSTNLVDWELVAIVPYAFSGSVTLSNQPSSRFYRVYNTY
jgi:hypothetical protein